MSICGWGCSLKNGHLFLNTALGVMLHRCQTSCFCECSWFSLRIKRQPLRMFVFLVFSAHYCSFWHINCKYMIWSLRCVSNRCAKVTIHVLTELTFDKFCNTNMQKKTKFNIARWMLIDHNIFCLLSVSGNLAYLILLYKLWLSRLSQCFV